MPGKGTRRDALRLGARALVMAPVVGLLSARVASAGLDISGVGAHATFLGDIQPPPRPLGRAIQAGIVVREAPGVKAREVRRLTLNEVVTLLGQTVGDGPTTYNPVWYQLPDGYAHSGFIQPCERVFNAPVELAEGERFWGEVTVPFVEARAQPHPSARLRYRYNYGCVFQVIASTVDAEGNPWYQIHDENLGNGFFVRAEAMRRIEEAEFAPLSPDVPPAYKRIEVDVAQQMIRAFERNEMVYEARTATGVAGTRTTPGEHRILKKTPSRHMTGGSGSGYYDLPGIGWCTYFTHSGIAIHATYWHNDYGRPRSHGCVNLFPEHAKWFFRWTTPVAPYSQRWTHTGRADEPSIVVVF
ncbi:MAG: L,D-transpeptidase family protein [Candidatus Roseilinea sp.]|uniref:L,D-transpeptidase family protein n=1 Tax=Candidatus Roseilinea sp. TaxID=2838777 RepID=UPI0040495BAA